jgi:hypothetical protein
VVGVFVVVSHEWGLSMKRWYKSKTVWINVLSLVAMVLATIAQWPELSDVAPQIVYALAIVNVLLRFVTSESVR